MIFSLLHFPHLQNLFPMSTGCHAPPIFSKVCTSSSKFPFLGFLFHLSTVLLPWPRFTASTISWKVTITRDFQSSSSVSLYIRSVTATTYINTTVNSPAADTIFKLWPVNWNQPLDGVASAAAKVQHSYQRTAKSTQKLVCFLSALYDSMPEQWKALPY